jgi:hypothetical protein
MYRSRTQKETGSRPTQRQPMRAHRTVLVAAGLAAITLAIVVTAGAVGAASQATAPQNTAAPSVTGTARQGSQLSATTGSWDGDTPLTLSFQWQRCSAQVTGCGNIASATVTSYTALHADVGSVLRVVVTAANGAGQSSAVSAPSAVVAAAGAAPNTAQQPTPQGTPAVGATLTAAEGTWTGDPPITFSYQWQRCTPTYSCANIPNATARTYAASSNDVGFRLRVVMTAKNAFGTKTVTSNATALVPSLQPAGATTLPDGRTSIPASSVALPQRLVIANVEFTPNPVRSRDVITARFRVTDTRGYVVRDARVYVVGLPYSWTHASREVATGSDGWAVIQITPTAAMPLKSGGAAVFFVRARKLGEPVLAGVSTRRLVQVRLARPF